MTGRKVSDIFNPYIFLVPSVSQHGREVALGQRRNTLRWQLGAFCFHSEYHVQTEGWECVHVATSAQRHDVVPCRQSLRSTGPSFDALLVYQNIIFECVVLDHELLTESTEFAFMFSWFAQIPTSEQQLWAHQWCFCAAYLLLLLSPLGTPRPCLSTVWILQSLIDCDPIRSPALETIYEERPWIRYAEPHWLRPHPVACPRNDLRRKTLDRGCTLPLDFFWLVLSFLYPVPSPPDLPCCRFLETLLVATACLCYFLCQAWQTWTYLSAFVQHACCHTGASRWSGGQP